MEKLTAEQYRSQYQKDLDARAESFARSDTDGFLSQWASGLGADLNLTLAELAEAGWVSSFPGLFSIETGERVPAKIISVPDRYSYGDRTRNIWALIDPKTGKFTGRFLPVGANSRKQKKYGFFEKEEIAPAYAKITGRGRGLSGSAWVSVFRTDGGYPSSLLKIKTADEVAAEILNKKPESIVGVDVQNKVSKNNKDFVRIYLSTNRVEIVLDVYNESFILASCSTRKNERETLNNIEATIDYIQYIAGV